MNIIFFLEFFLKRRLATLMHFKGFAVALYCPCMASADHILID